MKLALATLILVSLVLSSSIHAMAGDPNLPSALTAGRCGAKCSVRCKDAREKKRCLKYCGICCQKCRCVPAGTYGNKSECPCYDGMKNSKGTSKCP